MSIIFTDVAISFAQEQYVLQEGETITISVLIFPGPGVNASGTITLDFDPAPGLQCKEVGVIFVSVYQYISSV